MSSKPTLLDLFCGEGGIGRQARCGKDRSVRLPGGCLMKLIVYHTSYGCDTGCCGHAVEDEEGHEYRFRFTHPYSDDQLQFAQDLIREEFGEEHVADLDWANCMICDD